jgi:hypothetical protein
MTRFMVACMPGRSWASADRFRGGLGIKKADPFLVPGVELFRNLVRLGRFLPHSPGIPYSVETAGEKRRRKHRAS